MTSRAIGRAAAVLAAVCAAASAAPAGAVPSASAGGWGRPVPITRDANAWRLVTAVSERGTAAFAWQVGIGGERSRVCGCARARLQSPKGHMGKIQTLSRTRVGARSPQVVVDRHGRAIVLWMETRRGRSGAIPPQGEKVVAAIRAPGGRFGRPHVIGHTDGVFYFKGAPRLAVDEGGKVLALWARNGALQTATARPGHRFGQARTLPARRIAARDPQLELAFDRSGTAFAVWTRKGLQVAIKRPGHRFGRERELAPPPASEPNLAFGDDGTGVLVWRQSAPATSAEDDFGPIGALLRPPGGAFGAPRTIYPGLADGPQVTVTPSGEAIAAWLQGPGELVGFALRPPTGDFGPPAPLPPAADGPAGPMLVSDGRGDAAAFWSAGNRVFATVRPAGGDFGGPEQVSPPGVDASLRGVAAGRQVVVVFLAGNAHQAVTRTLP